MPLVQLPARSIVNMHELGRTDDENEDEPIYYRLSDEVQGEQLLINYCYGHPESSMIFFPSGSGSSLINHSKEPNAKMVWSDHPAHQRHWYTLTPEELLSQETLYIGLLIEIVALRDIVPGEEIFINYGSEYEEAWEKHVKQWEGMVAAGTLPNEWPTRALDLNEEYKGKVFKDKEQLKRESYPSNVMLKCFVQVSPDAKPEKVNGKTVREWAEPPTGAFDSDTLEDCIVETYEKTDDETSGLMPYNYTVTLLKDKQATLIQKVPHRAFVFVDKPGTSDQFVPNPFRHYISIPDDVFPQGPWRDLAGGKGTEPPSPQMN